MGKTKRDQMNIQVKGKLRISNLIDDMEDSKLAWQGHITKTDVKRLSKQARAQSEREDQDVDGRNKSRRTLKTEE